MRRFPFALVLLVVLFGLAPLACSDADPLSPSEQVALRGTEWLLVQMPGTTLASVRNAPTLLLGDNNRATGFAGCNRFTGSYTLASNDLRFSDMAMTRMFCAGAMDLENSYVSALESTRTYRISGSRLELLNDREVVVAIFEKR